MMVWIITVVFLLTTALLAFAGVSGIVWVLGFILDIEWSWILVILVWLIVMAIIVALAIRSVM